MRYAEIERHRQLIGGISRAAMCRRANVSESAVSKGLMLDRKPIDAVRDRLLEALSALQAERAQPFERRTAA